MTSVIYKPADLLLNKASYLLNENGYTIEDRDFIRDLLNQRLDQLGDVRGFNMYKAYDLITQVLDEAAQSENAGNDHSEKPIAGIAGTQSTDNIEQNQSLDNPLPAMPALIGTSLPAFQIGNSKNAGNDPQNAGYIDSISNYLSKGEAYGVNVAGTAGTPLRFVPADADRYTDNKLFEQDKEAVAFGNEAHAVNVEEDSVPEQEDADMVAHDNCVDEGCGDGCLGNSIVRAATPPSRHPNPNPNPYLGCLDLSKGEMISIAIEIWHNKETKGGGISEWVAKLHSSKAPDPNSTQRVPMDEHMLNFSNEPRRYRENLTDLAKKGRISFEEARHMQAQTKELELPVTTKCAILSQQINYHGATIRKGQSQREQRYFAHYWATLIVENNKPVSLTLMLGDEYEPIVLDKIIVAAEVRDPHRKYKNNAPAFLAYYDPLGIYRDRQREERAMRNRDAHTRQSIRYNPANALASYYEGLIANRDAKHERSMQMMMRDYTAQIADLKKNMEARLEKLTKAMGAN